MTHRFAELMFTPSVKAVQARMGSRGGYERFEDPETPAHSVLEEDERTFIAARDSFYVATVSETGWPYVQHRGGPPGFLKVLDERTIGFADYRGNRQYVSVGNLGRDGRVSLILVDYPNRRRLKIIGHARLVDLRSEPETIERLRDGDYDARIERAMVITIEAFDWNCPQHITPRFTEAQLREAVAPTLERLRAAEASATAALPRSLGTGPLELVVTGLRQLTPRIRAYELRRPDGAPLPKVAAGAHLIVPIRLADGSGTTRTYSISSDPAQHDHYEIAVLDEPTGRGGSAAVHRDYALGLTLHCGPPGNAFALHEDTRPGLLIAGGVGITPLRAMAQALKADGRGVQLHYAARSRREAAYASELAALLGAGFTLHASDAGDRLDIAAALAAMPSDGVAYVCGPGPMIEAARAAAQTLGIASRLRFERFAADARRDDQPFDIVLSRSGERVHVAAGETALDALERAGAAVPSSCRAGACRTCVVKRIAGDADHRDQVLSERERAAGQFTPCVSRARGAELVLDL
jgi:hypothetical protein